MAKKQKTTDTLNLESILFNCREYLRSNASLNDKRDLLLTLVFLRFIGEKFENTQNEMRQECYNNNIVEEEAVSYFLNSPNRYKGIAFVPEKARWSTIIEQPASKLNATLDDAIQELENSSEALKGCVRLGLFTSINLEANVIKKVVDEVNKISHKTFGEEKDLIGRVY
ncbi:MAG: type I restriction-modification system subunit M N-terminal domain-containing protein, partial [Chitinophagaceae bacterium]